VCRLQFLVKLVEFSATDEKDAMRTGGGMARDLFGEVVFEKQRQLLVGVTVPIGDVEVDEEVLDDHVHVVSHPEEELLERGLAVARKLCVIGGRRRLEPRHHDLVAGQVTHGPEGLKRQVPRAVLHCESGMVRVNDAAVIKTGEHCERNHRVLAALPPKKFLPFLA
jgi:hypothetical protein